MFLLMKWISLFIALVLVSCIEGDEEIFVNADGSGKVKLVYKVPALLLDEQASVALTESVNQNVGGDKNLRLITNRVDQSDGQKLIVIEIEADDVMKLNLPEADTCNGDYTESQSINILDKINILDAIIGKVGVKLQGLQTHIQRDVNLMPLLKERFGEGALSGLGAAEFKYALHLPVPAQSTNAHEVENNGKTLKWTYRLSEMKEKPIQLLVTSRVPIPWWIYAAGGAVILLIILMIFIVLRRRR